MTQTRGIHDGALAQMNIVAVFPARSRTPTLPVAECQVEEVA